MRSEYRVRTGERKLEFVRCGHFHPPTVSLESTNRYILNSLPFFRAGSYPTVASHTGEWALNPSSHSLDWSIALINSDDRSGTLEFTVGGDDAGAFFPVKVTFAGQGSLSGLSVGSIALVDGGDVTFSQEEIIAVDNYTVVG